jgi:hypothetical protein
MAIILGLDVSTSVTGVCVVNSDVKPDDEGSHILLLDRIEFTKCKTLWDKADLVSQYMDDLIRGSYPMNRPVIVPTDDGDHTGMICADRIVLEEPLMGFRPGMSSALTISTLMRFNGIVSYLARRTFRKEPEYIGSAHARKLCGIKLQRTALGGPQKEQVFAHMEAHDLKHVQWPLKKSGKVVDWSRDACDAYVIARAAAVNGPVQPPVKKPKKSKKADEE